ncbi:hypothetical protein TSUD_209280 [Trifolium subterraneum]|uniref:Transposase-associated domain-containing protein n=1 Tax=Trifolium subterraneum TaxID=3900 RepID=A0A2Z6P3U4_TRISU|nr:hypothetical protein TSUD_209280 [Trifolium subterraneum]
MNFTDRSWMYDRHDHGKRSGQVKEFFKLGVELFITTVKQNPIVIREGGIRCPCAVCQCTCMKSEDDIRKHLYRKEFQPNYWVWSSHGEGSTSAPVSFGRASTSRIEPVAVPQNYQHYDPFNEMNSMITNALGYNVPIYVPNDVHDPEEDNYDGDVHVERPNDEAQRLLPPHLRDDDEIRRRIISAHFVEYYAGGMRRGRRFASGSTSSFFQSDPYGIRDIADDSSRGSHRSTGRSRPSQETDEAYEERLRASIRDELREEVRQENQQQVQQQVQEQLQQQVQELVQQQLRHYEATRGAMWQGYVPQPQYNNPRNNSTSALGNLHGGSEGYRPDLTNMSRNVPSQLEYRPNDPMVNFNIDDFDIDDISIDLNDIPLHVEDTWQGGNSSGGRLPTRGSQIGARRQRVVQPTLTINEGGQNTRRRRAPAPRANDKGKGKQPQVLPEEDDVFYE